MILDADITPDHFDGVTAYMTSSAAIPPDVIRAFERRYGIPVLLGYGATEFLSSVTGWTPAAVDRVRREQGRQRRAARCPGCDCAVVDGLLEVDPPQRAKTCRPAGCAPPTVRRIDDDGFVWILGRADSVIVRGGFKVDLGAIEAALLGTS